MQNRNWSATLKKVAYVFLGGFVLSVVLAIALGDSSENKSPASVEQRTEENVKPENKEVAPKETTATNIPEQSNELSKKDEAQKELTSLMDLSKKSGLVTSYEFSDTANVVYVTDLWYSANVTFKKDFLAKISTLKEAITGYHRFEVRDSKSNEKVAEVTAFSGSLEVYK